MVDKICKDQPSSLYIRLSGPNIITSLVHCIQSIHTITCVGREGRNGRVDKRMGGIERVQGGRNTGREFVREEREKEKEVGREEVV